MQAAYKRSVPAYAAIYPSDTIYLDTEKGAHSGLPFGLLEVCCRASFCALAAFIVLFVLFLLALLFAGCGTG